RRRAARPRDGDRRRRARRARLDPEVRGADRDLARPDRRHPPPRRRPRRRPDVRPRCGALVRGLFEERPALVLVEPAPDAVRIAYLQRVLQAVAPHPATAADRLGPRLTGVACPLRLRYRRREEQRRLGSPAGGVALPGLLDGPHAHPASPPTRPLPQGCRASGTYRRPGRELKTLIRWNRPRRPIRR